MKKTYYLFNPGRLSRKDNTLKYVPVDAQGREGQPKYLPVEGIENLYCFGSLDANSALYNFLGKQQIAVHFFDYYEHYTGSFMPKDYLLSGAVLVNQVRQYQNHKKRMQIARAFVSGAAFNILKNLRYYDRKERELQEVIARIERFSAQIVETTAIEELMGIEGNIRSSYYSVFGQIITDFEMNNREKQPPSNEVNAMISFVNMMCYTLCLGQLYHTQLNPTVSFLHEPGYRRFSLALDLAEIFKPILVDRLIFSLLNKRVVQAKDFDRKLKGCYLSESGRKKVIKAWDDKLKETIKHRTLGQHVSYKKLVRLEGYKLVKHVMNIQEYKPFKAWW